jgi:superfamily II DNA or RNA helicase
VSAVDLFTPLAQRPILRPYQQKGVDEILACVQRGLNPLYCLPTAGGKGPIIGAVTEVIEQQPDYEVWLFAHREELVNQLSEHLENVGVEHGIIASWAPLTNHRTMVCSVDTVRSRIDQLRHRFPKVRVVVIDECHHATTNTYETIAELCTKAQFIGTTATPFRHDGKALGTRFDAEVRGPSIKHLEVSEFISPIRLMAPPTKLNLTRIKKRMGDFVLAQLAAAVNTDDVTQAAIYAYALHAGGLPTLAFCVDVQHAVDAAHAFKAAGWSVEVMESTFKNCLDAQPGENKRTARRRCIGGLASGRYQILFTIGMAGEGVDVPVCGAGLDLRPTESTQLWLQHLGRIKRLYAGKTEGIWLDLVGNWSKHGMPNADRQWSLAGGLRGIEKAVAAVRRCGNCHFVSERGPERCAVCNRKYPAPRPLAPGQSAISDARLASLPGLNGLSAEQVKNTPLKALLPLAREYDDLVTIQKIKNYKLSWLTYVAAEKGLRPKTFGSAVPAPRRRGRW